MRGIFRSGLPLLPLVLAGCSAIDVQPKALGSYPTLFGQADTRMIEAAPSNLDVYGKNHPIQITCAEPSPDIAKAIDTAFGTGATINVNGAPGTPGQLGEAAAAVSQSRAEALAQLGERMASIQLLRDGLFRSCEAFQNGALGPTSYALILSRFGDTMVTMLGTELIAGEFGRSGAAAGGSANGSANASTGQQADSAAVQAANTAVSGAQDALTTQQGNLASDQLALNALNNPPAGATPPTSDQLLQAQQKVAVDKVNVQGAQVKLAAAQQAAQGALSAAATSAATANGSGIGGINRTVTDEGARRIAELVRSYMSAPTLHSIMTACIATLEDNFRANTNFGQFCRQSMLDLSSRLAQGYEKQVEGLAATTAEADFRHDVDRVKRFKKMIDTLAANSAPAPAPHK